MTESQGTEKLPVLQAARGDMAAFATLVEEFQALVCGTAFVMCRDRALSEDIAQQVFIRLWRALPTIENPLGIATWLRVTTKRIAVDVFRKHKEVLNDRLAEPITTQSPYDLVNEAERASLVARALEQMAEPYREPMILFYRDASPIEKIAEWLELSTDAVKQRLSRGRKQLHASLAPIFEQEMRSTRPTKALTVAIVAAVAALSEIPWAEAGTDGTHARAQSQKLLMNSAKKTWLSSGFGWLWAIFLLCAIVAGTTVGVLRYRNINRENETVASAAKVTAFAQRAGASSAHGKGAADAEVGLTVDGFVVDKHGNPVEGATVLSHRGETSTGSMITGADGYFAFHGVPPGEAMLSAHSPLGAVSAAISLVRERGAVTLVLAPLVPVRLRVVDVETGLAIAGAQVKVTGLGKENIFTTDATGTLRFSLAGHQNITVSKSNYADWTGRAAGTEILAQMIPGSNVVGSVLDPRGQPAKNAKITLLHTSRLTGQRVVNGVAKKATSDASGRFALSAIAPGDYYLMASGENAAQSIMVPVSAVSGEDTESVVLQLRAGRYLAGTVTDETGKPVSGAVVSASEMASPSKPASLLAPGAVEGTTVIADVNGRFVFDNTIEDAVVVKAHDNFGRVASAAVPLSQFGELKLVLQERIISGHAVDDDGEPVAGVQIVAHPAGSLGGSMQMDTTSDDGAFFLAGLHDPSYQVMSYDGSGPIMMSDRVIAKPGATDVKIVVPNLTSVTGKLVAEDGGTVGLCRVLAGNTTFYSSFPSGELITDALLHMKVPMGEQYLQINCEGFVEKVLRETFVKGQTRDLGEIRLASGKTITGRVVTSNGDPVPATQVSAAIGLSLNERGSLFGPQQVSTYTDADGNFSLSGVDPTITQIAALHPTRGYSGIKIFASKSTQAIQLELPDQFSVTGRLLSGNRPVSRVRLIFRGASTEEAAMTNADGVYEAKLAVGTYEVVRQANVEGQSKPLATIHVTANLRQDFSAGPGGAVVIETSANMVGSIFSLRATSGLREAVAVQAAGQSKFAATFHWVEPGTYEICPNVQVSETTRENCRNVTVGDTGLTTHW